LIFLLPSMLLIILFAFIASLLSLVLMAQLFLGLLFIYHLKALSFLSTLLPLLSLPSWRCSTRISPCSSLIHTLHYSTQFSNLCFVCHSSSICWWHSIVHLLPGTWIFRQYISSVSKSCFLSICDLRRIRNILDFSTARTIATSLIHRRQASCSLDCTMVRLKVSFSKG